MTHARQQIRESAVASITGLTTTGANVYKTRLFPLEQANLPAWSVYAEDEESENVDTARTQQRELELTFLGVAREVSGTVLEDTLDLMAEELETALDKASFAGLVKGLEYAGTEFEFGSDDVDQAVGSIAVTYLVTYFTAEGAPGTLI